MRIWPICVPCIYSARAREIIESDLDRSEKIYALAKLHAFMSSATPYSSTIGLASEAYRLVKRLIHNPDPYKEYKNECNNFVKRKILPHVKKLISDKDTFTSFRTLLIASIAANVLDPGVPGYGELKIDLKVRLTRDESRKAFELVFSSKKVLYILDNAGEAIIDLEVVKLISEAGIEVTVLAKSLPYQNDVTVDEAKKLGFNKYARVLGTGSDEGGPLPKGLSKEAYEAITESDAVIAKGMAAFESFEEWNPSRPIIHVLRAKCLPVATAARLNVGEGGIFIRWPLS